MQLPCQRDLLLSKKEVHLSKRDLHLSKRELQPSHRDLHLSKEEALPSKGELHPSQDRSRSIRRSGAKTGGGNFRATRSG